MLRHLVIQSSARQSTRSLKDTLSAQRILQYRWGKASFSVSPVTLAASTSSSININFKKVSNVKAKLDHYVETGQIISKSPRQYQSNKSRKISQSNPLNSNYSKQKTLLLLKSNYEGKLQNSEGESIDVRFVKVSDLNPYTAKNKQIFNALQNMGKMTKKPVSKRLMMSLLGVPMNHLNDPFVVTKEIIKLLENDGDCVRAKWLAKAATSGEVASVGMNEIMKFQLEKGDVKDALKCFNDRKKWNIPLNNQTYIILFDGLAKAHAFGGVSDQLAQQAIDIFESFMQKTLPKKSNGEPKEEEEEEEDFDSNKVSKKSAKDAAKSGNRNPLKCSIEHFNSCLNLVSRNFTGDQSMAWSFFDILVPDKTDPRASKYQQLYPDIETYTTLLNGVKKFCNHQSKTITEDRNMRREEKTLRLLEIDAKLVSTAEMILGKVIQVSTPPVPPTKEQSTNNPNLLVEYKKAIRKPLVEIDATFIGLFISCFINNTSGTGMTSSGAGHYEYINRGIEYLRIWCPEVDKMLNTINQAHFKTDDSIVKLTNERLESAKKYYEDNKATIDFKFLDGDGGINDILPSTVTSLPVKESDVNPLVIFPPPLLSKNKTKAVFNGKPKRLIDITRPPRKVFQAILDNRQYIKSKGKYGKKIPSSMDTSLRLEPINRFIFGLALEGLLRLGLFKQFYLGMWYGLTRWGGLSLDLDKIIKHVSSGNSLGQHKGGALEEDAYCKISSITSAELKPRKDSGINEKIGGVGDELSSEGSPEVAEDIHGDVASLEEAKPANLPTHKVAVIDNLMVENFLYKINENCPNYASQSKLAVELVNALVNPEVNKSYSLVPRYKTIDSVFAILTKELYDLKDSNYRFNKRISDINNTTTAKKALNEQQLNDFTTTLIKLMDCLIVKSYEEEKTNTKKNPDLVAQKQFIESYVNFVGKIRKFSWTFAGEQKAHARFLTEVRILRSGIQMYMPPTLIDKRKEIITHSNDAIKPSIGNIISSLQEREDLDANESFLLKWLKIVAKFEGDSAEKLGGLLHKVRDGCDRVLDPKSK